MSEPGAPPPNPYAQPSGATPQPQPQPYPSTPAGPTPYPPPGGQYPPPPGGQYPPPYGQYPWPAEQQPKPGVNGLAVAALVLGIIAIFPLAIIFGIIALVQISRTGQKGRGLAIGGLVTAGLWLALIVGAIIWAVMTMADRDEDGAIVEEGDVSTLDLRVGDCVTGLRDTEDETSMATVPALPCDQPHEGEVYATFDLDEGEYPGEAVLFATIEERCLEELETFSQQAWDDPNISVFYLYPEERSWSYDRGAVCIAYALEGTLTGSLATQDG
ncbi:DUF4190 domain-containing protein [Jiangella anatolica]|uniref:Peptidylprolyl isomerase n=1 Tax=Jiangella anatolica TaxID=2670374 RepID=A0A2W2BQN4_9ACTN|nr:DUF4190 domain-containing protein [Jiangella anatolica]PZF82674.1 peptidylprolyl isomerase [Jiangella anatolica]